MTVEDQLREYSATLDAATEEAARTSAHRVASVVRIRPARTLVLVAIAVAATIAIALAAVGASHRSTTPPLGSEPPTTALPTAKWPNREGMTLVADHAGNVAGYVETALVEPREREVVLSSNARTLLPVTDAAGHLVGKWAFATGFIPLDVVNAPGFDIEDYRAKAYGGCEPAIGNGVGQKYPLCPSGTGDAP